MPKHIWVIEVGKQSYEGKPRKQIVAKKNSRYNFQFTEVSKHAFFYEYDNKWYVKLKELCDAVGWQNVYGKKNNSMSRYAIKNYKDLQSFLKELGIKVPETYDLKDIPEKL